MTLHWHLRYTNRTACGILAYKTRWPGEYDTARNGRIECAEAPRAVSCIRCRRIMDITTPLKEKA